VREELLHRDGPVLLLEDGLAVVAEALEHLEVGDLGHVLARLAVEVHLALLDKLERCDGATELCTAKQLEARVLLDRRALLGELFGADLLCREASPAGVAPVQRRVVARRREEDGARDLAVRVDGGLAQVLVERGSGGEGHGGVEVVVRRGRREYGAAGRASWSSCSMESAGLSRSSPGAV